MNVLESSLERRLVQKAKEAGGLALKWVSPGSMGVPDRILLLPGGVVRFVEVKAPGKKLRPVQEVVHQRLKAFGLDVRVVESKEGIDAVFTEGQPAAGV